MTDNCIVLYVWDMTKPNVNHDYWMKSIQSFAPQSHLVTVGTHLGEIISDYVIITDRRIFCIWIQDLE